jgi:hypothetical protein
MEIEANSRTSMTREPTGDTIVLLYEARPFPPDLTGHSLTLKRELLKLGVQVETHSFSPEADLREEQADAAVAGRHRVIMARGDRLALYRERGAYGLPFIAVGVQVSEDYAEQVVNFVNASEAPFVARMVCIFLLDRLVAKQLVLPILIQNEITTLAYGSMVERYNVLREMGSLPVDSRQPVRERLLRELTSIYSPGEAHLTELRAVAQYVRGWLISALGALGGNESARMLADYYRSGAEPDETARYWLLANLYWGRSPESPQIVREAATKDPSDLVRKLALAILAWDSPEELASLMRSLQQPENSHELWTALRALQIVPIPAAFEAVMEVTAKTSEVAFMYDGLLVLYEYLHTRQPDRVEGLIEQFRKAVPAETAARIVLAASKGTSEAYLGRFVWLLRQLEVPPIAKIFQDSLLHTDPEVALTARRLLDILGITDSAVLPIGTERLRLAFAAVIRHPRQYQVIESLAPERLATLARAVPTPPAEVTEPLWEAWMEVVHLARLSDQPLAATLSPATKDDNKS